MSEAEAAVRGPVIRRRRKWSEAEKRRIVAESHAPGVSVSVVARRHDVNANLLFTWRRQMQEQAACGAFVPMVLTEESGCGALSADEQPSGRTAEDPADCVQAATGRIEIVLGGGRRVIVDREVDATALARVVEVLERR